MIKNVLLSGVLAVLFWIPAAVLVAVVYRFPIPFCCYAHGLSELDKVPLAVLFYGLFGGFPILAVLGGIGGWWWTNRTTGVAPVSRKPIYLTAAGLALSAALFLAFLEELIGPW